MTDLTDKWRKGKLPAGYYYIEAITGEKIIDFMPYKEKEFKLFPSHISIVICEVPTFEEWQANQKWIKHLEEKIKIYERKDKQATETSIAYNELAEENKELKEILERHKKATAKAQIRSLDLEIINDKLKELLKECKPFIELCNYTPENKRLLERIVEQIGEE